MIPPTTTPLFVGSHLVPTGCYLRQFVHSLQTARGDTANAPKKDLVAAHRSMVLYTLQLLCACTGHRAVSDPFWNLDHFDLTNGQVLIDDKSITSHQGYRLAYLPPLACRQLQLYLQHLRNLSRLIRRLNPELADQLWAITEADFLRPMPLFFFLEADSDDIRWTRILPGGLASILEPFWALPLNSNRHILSTWLHETRCPSELIDAQLGHIEAGCAPFGAVSPLAPNKVGLLLRPFLERFLEEYGWTEAQGLHAPNRLPAIVPHPKAKALASPPLLGAAVRLANREALWRKDSERVIDLIKKSFRSYPPTSISAEELSNLEEQVVAEGQRHGRVLVHLLLFRRHLKKLRHDGMATPLPGRLAIIKPERHNFTDSSLLAKHELDRLRAQFMEHLAQQEGTPYSNSRRIAELLISSILFGAQFNRQFLEALPHAIANATWRLEDFVFVDVSAMQSSPVRRWLPDRISEALLLGYFNARQPSTEKQTAVDHQAEIAQELSAILKALNASRPKQGSVKPPALDKLLTPLCVLARAAWKFVLPGAMSEYAAGEHACASPPLSNWMRLQNGKAGAVAVQRFPEETAPTGEDLTRIPRPKDPNPSRARSMKDWRELTKCFGETDSKESAEVAGSLEKRFRASKRSNARKLRFEQEINALIEAKGENFSPTVACLAAWAIHLCRHGTRHTSVLRANSVSSYVRAIGSTLTELAYDKDFLSLSSVVLEDLFRNVVESAPRKNQTYVIGRLKEFHYFLQLKYGMPEIDWGEVVDDELLEADAIDSGVVTLAEFHRAINIIMGSPGVEDRTRRARAVLLTLIYRFGLRVGEAFRLTVSDVLCHQDQIILYVRNSIHGETKTDHGMRQLPLLGSISDLEKQLLSQWLAHSREYAGGPLALLFPEVDDSRHGIDRTTTSAAMTAALRLSCGDENVRLRHLRHTCASRLFLVMLCPQVPQGRTGRVYRALWAEHPPEEIRALLLGDTAISRRGLYAVALYMGHASPKTTLRHYIHSADLVLKDQIDGMDFALSDRALAYCYQVNYSNLRKIRSRLQAASEAGKATRPLQEEFLQRAHIPQPEFKEQEALPAEQIIEPPLKELEPADLDRLLTIATMRGTIEGLGDRFLCSDYVVIEALSEAVRQQEVSGYTDFGLTIRDTDDYWVAPNYLRRPTLDKESGRVRRFLVQVARNPHHIKALSTLAEIWAKSYLPYSTPLLINRKSDLKRSIESWQTLGMEIRDFEAILPNVPWGNEFIEINQREQLLNSMGIKVRKASRLPQRTAPDIPGNRVGLVLRPSDSHKLGYQTPLNRVLFIMAVWKRLTDLAD